MLCGRSGVCRYGWLDGRPSPVLQLTRGNKGDFGHTSPHEKVRAFCCAPFGRVLSCWYIAPHRFRSSRESPVKCLAGLLFWVAPIPLPARKTIWHDSRHLPWAEWRFGIIAANPILDLSADAEGKFRFGFFSHNRFDGRHLVKL